jgi:hypothetical protein
MPGLSPVVFAQHAQQFLDAAKREAAHAPMGTSLPAYFLVGRSIELALKSFLLLEGCGEADLRRVSHNLAAGLELAESRGLSSVVTLSPESRQALQWINPYYQSKDLEYPTTGYKSYPELRYVEEVAATLLKSIQPRLRAWRPA